MKTTVAFLAILAGCSADDARPSGALPADASPAEGYDKGSMFPDVALEGFVDRNANKSFEPTEFGAFRVRDVLDGKPEYLLVHVSFGWCEWCWDEAKEQLRWVNAYGARFRALQVYVDDLRGERATRSDLEFWIAQNASHIPAGLEPSETLLKKFGRNATYLLIDVQNGMKILDVGAGPPAFSRMRGFLADKLGPLPDAATDAATGE